jgi:predicted P-loop ATPase
MRDNILILQEKQFSNKATFFLIISYFFFKTDKEFSLYFCKNFNILKYL